MFLLSGAASVERFGLDFWSRPDYYLSMWQEPVNMAVLGGLCGWTYVSPADSRKYYPSYVTAIYFIGIALVCCNIHMVTRRCPRQPGRMCDQRPIYFTNDAYSDPAIVAALFWFRAVLVIAPALAAAIFRVRFPALALGTTLTTLYCAFVFLVRGQWKISNLLLFEALGESCAAARRRPAAARRRPPPPRRRPAAAPHRPPSLSLRPANRTTRDHRPRTARPHPPPAAADAAPPRPPACSSPRQAAFIVLPPSIMMVICYMIISANLKMLKALDSNRRQAAAVEEVVRTVGETSIAVTARPNKADAPACSARAG